MMEKGLSNYGMFKQPRKSDLDVFNQIDKQFESIENKRDGWEVLQEKIVEFQDTTAIDQYKEVILGIKK
jgi:hypothetical protein